MFIVSKCLIGIKSKYNGGDNLTKDVVKFTQSYACYYVCPESVYLPIPREPAEIRVSTADSSFTVINKAGADVTKEFIAGALDSIVEVEKYAVENDEIIEGAVLKAKSPSCGYGEIYDGKFSHNIVDGNGVFAELLMDEFSGFLRGEKTLVDGVRFSEDFIIANEGNLNELLGR